jgi:hypothetical protein
MVVSEYFILRPGNHRIRNPSDRDFSNVLLEADDMIKSFAVHPLGQMLPDFGLGKFAIMTERFKAVMVGGSGGDRSGDESHRHVAGDSTEHGNVDRSRRVGVTLIVGGNGGESVEADVERTDSFASLVPSTSLISL